MRFRDVYKWVNGELQQCQMSIYGSKITTFSIRFLVTVSCISITSSPQGALLLNNILAFIAAVLMTGSYYVNVYHLIILGRLIIGFNCGTVGEYGSGEVGTVSIRGSGWCRNYVSMDLRTVLMN